MFFGQYQHTLDLKGRLSIPGRIREVLVNGSQDMLIVTKGFEPCLFAFSPEEWQRFLTWTRTLPDMDRDVRDYKRHMVGPATECPLDRQGRILIPQVLRDYAGLNKDVMLVGLDDKIEIWDQRKYKEKELLIAQSADIIGQRLANYHGRKEE